MNPSPKPIRIRDPVSGQTWSVPIKPITSLNADVAERWFINVALPVDRFREIVPATFLQPDLRHGKIVLSLCRIRMRHGAPDWMPLSLGPASDNCALRVGCIDSRDGSPTVWVDHRLTTHVLGRALDRLGFPPVKPHLVIQRSDETGLQLRSRDGSMRCTAEAKGGDQPTLFTNTTELTTWVTAGVRSYAATAAPNRYRIVDLEKGSPNAFTLCQNWGAQLTTPWGSWKADGVYRTVNGQYQWRVLGTVDHAGNPVAN